MKASSYTKYAAETQACAVERDVDEVSVVPYHNNGPRQGMTALLDQAERLTSPAPLEIAEAAQRVIRRAAA